MGLDLGNEAHGIKGLVTDVLILITFLMEPLGECSAASAACSQDVHRIAARVSAILIYLDRAHIVVRVPFWRSLSVRSASSWARHSPYLYSGTMASPFDDYSGKVHPNR